MILSVACEIGDVRTEIVAEDINGGPDVADTFLRMAVERTLQAYAGMQAAEGESA